MAHIHWYPGHIAKAQKQLKEKLNLVDVIIEIIDIRIPYSSRYKDIEKLCPNKKRLILANKSDLSDDNFDKIWTKIIEKETNSKVLITNLSKKSDIKLITNLVIDLSKEIMQKRLEKGLLTRPTRTMVVGMPNVGKSSTINRLVGRSKTKTGAKAGVTRQQQWVRINDKIELLDTPGIIPTIQDDQNQAIRLAMVNSIGENAYEAESVAFELLKILEKYYEKEIRSYYNLKDEEITLENIALKRNWILKQGIADIKRTALTVLSNFREGKIGKFTLERPEEYGLI